MVKLGFIFFLKAPCYFNEHEIFNGFSPIMVNETFTGATFLSPTFPHP
jgi:hypothetical protein